MAKLTKTEIAKQLNISRTTLWSRIKKGEKIVLPHLNIESEKLCIKFSADNNRFSPHEIENFLEDLQDYGFLNEKGVAFRSSYWNMFIKDN